MRFRSPDLDGFPSEEKRRDLVDVAVTHAVYGRMNGLVGFLDEDMLWLSYPEPSWTAEVSRTLLARADEAMAAVAGHGFEYDEVDKLLPGGLTVGRTMLGVLKERRPGPEGRPQRLGSYLSDFYDALLPMDRPVLLHEVGWGLKCSLELVLRGLVEVVAACHRLIGGPDGWAPDSYAEVHPDLTPRCPHGRPRTRCEAT